MILPALRAGVFCSKPIKFRLPLLVRGVAYFLSVGLNFSDPVHIYTLKKGTKGRPSVANAFTHATIYASGIFSNQQEIDSKYVLVPFEFAQELFQLGKQVSAVEIELTDGISDDQVKSEVNRLLGGNFVVKTQFEQHELFYRVMQSEKMGDIPHFGFYPDHCLIQYSGFALDVDY